MFRLCPGKIKEIRPAARFLIGRLRQNTHKYILYKLYTRRSRYLYYVRIGSDA